MNVVKSWWEKEPIRFECQSGCFKCCAKPGVIYFDKVAIKNAAKIIKVSVDHFKKDFLKLDDGQWIHEVENGNPCSFLTSTGCAIHIGKPLQCRAYPFWKEHMTSKRMWKLLGGFCPGIDIGSYVPATTIRMFLSQFKL